MKLPGAGMAILQIKPDVRMTKMTIDEMTGKMEAAFFDMDGTLLDTMDKWRSLNLDYLRLMGVEPSPEDIPYILQASSSTIFYEYAREKYNLSIDAATFSSIQKARMEKVYRAGAPLKPGVEGYLRRLRARGVKICVTTATWASHTVLALSQSGLLPLIDGIYTCDAVKRSKREVAYFEEVSGLAGVPLDRTVLFEDAIYAMETGRAAGLLGIVGITDDTNGIYRGRIKEISVALVDSMDELP